MGTKILLVEDHVLIREALRFELDNELGFEVVGETGEGRDSVRLARELSPDLVLMDISMPNLNGIEATRQITSENPDIKILALSMHADHFLVTEMLKAGARGYLVKQCTTEELLKALRAVADGQTYLSPSVAGMIVDGFLGKRSVASSPAFTVLSPREREVLQLVAEGKSTREISHQLSISISTVETHRRQLKQKLNIQTQAGLIKFAIVEGLTTLDQ